MTDLSPRRPLRAGGLVLLLGLGGFAAWAALTRIEGAVVAPGRVEAEARRQIIQHPDGGVIAAIAVREGDRVAAGAEILRLDSAELAAERAHAARDLAEVRARLDRLAAEIDGAAVPVFRPVLQRAAVSDRGIAALLAGESAFQRARGASRARALEELAARARAVTAGVAGRQRQIAALQAQATLVEADLATARSLLAEGLAEAARVSALRREAARIAGELGALQAAVAEAEAAARGIEAERLRIEAQWAESLRSERRTLEPREAELEGLLRVLDSRLARLVLRAPMAGRVLGLRAATQGGVVAPGAEVAAIVPEDSPRIVTVEIDPREIDRVRPGQAAVLRLPGAGSGRTPEIAATIARVSADTLTDAATGRRVFLAELVPVRPPGRGGPELVPGMPVEAFIRTGARSPASWLLRPLFDHLAPALRED